MPLNDDSPSLNLNSVIYGTDFSETAKNAGSYAVLMAARCEARLLVAHAFTLATAAMDVEIAHSYPSQQRKDIEAMLEARARTLSTDTLRAMPVLLTGDPRQKLPALAEEHAPSLLVLGTHGRGWLGRELLGSVAEEILRSTRWPVLTINPRARGVSPDAPFRRILYATDLSPAAARAASFALTFARAFGSDLDVLHVMEKEMAGNPEQLAAARDRFLKASDDLIRGNSGDFCNPTTFIETGHAHERILRHIQERSVDLLVLGLQKTEYPRLRVRLSRAFDLISKADCPTLTITG